MRNYDNRLKKDSVLEGKSFMDVKNMGLLQCVKTCMVRSRCTSFNFDSTEMSCQLNDVLAVSEILKKRNGSFYGEIKNWPQELAKSCASHKCGYDEICSPLTHGTPRCVTDIQAAEREGKKKKKQRRNGYTRVGKFYYKFNNTRVSCRTALKTCSNDGGNLLQLSSHEERVAITKFLTGYLGCDLDRPSGTEYHVQEEKGTRPMPCHNYCNKYPFVAAQGNRHCFCMKEKPTVLNLEIERCNSKCYGNPLVPCGEQNATAWFSMERKFLTSPWPVAAYIGLFDTETRGIWTWETEGRANFTNFYPSMIAKDSRCAVLTEKTGWTWRSVPCNARFNFICERTL
ncbi:uncharacterized protein LOC121368783 [Gigantopelta aegis]|uniref:uncharacterized protein LOC121368783 n=1 Tax=Gigantopelta aegis TaxID=1735272 RepID=UPI001B889576|nr:uncharacterized protein LOC121368783 [Gigantopelta aegis]